MLHLRWKRSATSTDMTEVLRYCRARGWHVAAMGGRFGWFIFTRKRAE